MCSILYTIQRWCQIEYHSISDNRFIELEYERFKSKLTMISTLTLNICCAWPWRWWWWWCVHVHSWVSFINWHSMYLGFALHFSLKSDENRRSFCTTPHESFALLFNFWLDFLFVLSIFVIILYTNVQMKRHTHTISRRTLVAIFQLYSLITFDSIDGLSYSIVQNTISKFLSFIVLFIFRHIPFHSVMWYS